MTARSLARVGLIAWIHNWHRDRTPGQLSTRGRRRRDKRRERAARRRAVMRGHREACRLGIRAIRIDVAPMRPTRDRCHYDNFVEVWALRDDRHGEGLIEVWSGRAR